MDRVVRSLMDILRSEVSREPFDAELFLSLTPEEQKQLAVLAKKHSLAQLVGDALGKCPRTANLPATAALLPVTLSALRQVERIEFERKRICSVLDEIGIPYIPLKGARIRPCYPEPWMRSSCDNDILVPEADAERAARCLESRLNYRYEARNHHDISLFSQAGIPLELHFSILENEKTMDRVLGRVWEFSAPVRENALEYAQTPEYFIFHLIAHMVHHFVTGGCGIRPFLDLFLLQGQLAYSEPRVEDLCRQAGIGLFYDGVRRLTDVWFRHAPGTPATDRMEQYLLTGGTYGSNRNQAAVEETRGGTRNALVLHRIFATREHLCGRYPRLKDHPWLMPWYQVRRWVTASRRGRFRMLRSEWQVSRDLDPEQAARIEQMLQENGLL